jgi:hypothetical protein
VTWFEHFVMISGAYVALAALIHLALTARAQPRATPQPY